MESKLGENFHAGVSGTGDMGGLPADLIEGYLRIQLLVFCSLQTTFHDSSVRDRPAAIYFSTPSPSIFTGESQEMFHWNKGELNIPTHTKIVRENSLTHLGSIASGFMPITMHCQRNSIKNCYLYRQKSTDPLPSIFRAIPFKK